MEKERGIIIVGAGKVGKIATTNSLSSIILGEEVRKKAFHKTDEEIKQEQLESARKSLPDAWINEYKLIQQKKSKLCRAKRDYIVREVEKELTNSQHNQRD